MEVIAEMQSEEQIREDADEVLNAGVSYAKRMLRKYGQFAPFGYRMNEDGKVQLEVVAQQDMPPEPAMLMELLYQQLAERAGKGLLRASAIASNVAMNRPSKEGFADAVMVEIEQDSGYSMRAFVPYGITGGQFHGFFPRVIRFGAMQTEESKPRLFRR
jgi:hypothetical protein